MSWTEPDPRKQRQTAALRAAGICPYHFFERVTLGERVVHVFLLERLCADFGLDTVNAFLRVLFRPAGFAILVPDVHDIPMVSFITGTFHAAVKSDQVSAEYHQQILADGSGWKQSLLEPFPFLFQDVRVPAVRIRIEVIHESRVRTNSVLSCSTR